MHQPQAVRQWRELRSLVSGILVSVNFCLGYWNWDVPYLTTPMARVALQLAPAAITDFSPTPPIRRCLSVRRSTPTAPIGRVVSVRRNDEIDVITCVLSINGLLTK